MLREVEELYGARDRAWTPLGIEFGPTIPHVWYPGTCGHIVIQLSRNAIDDNVLACYQLAHETVHLLAPTGGKPALVLEEGVATVYSEDYVKREFGRTGMTDLESYRQAAEKVRALLLIDSGAIRKLRAVDPSFLGLSVDSFALAGLAVDPGFAAELLSPFSR